MSKYRLVIFYIIGQGIGYIIDIGLFYILTVAGLGNYITNNIVGKSIAALFAYLFHGYYTFSGDKSNSKTQSIGFYMIVLIVNMVITSAIIYGMQIFLLWSVVIIKLIADIIAIIFTFILMNRFVFPRARQE